MPVDLYTDAQCCVERGFNASAKSIDSGLHIIGTYYIMIHWRGHQTSPTVVSLQGRLSQKLQSKASLSFEIVQKHSLFRHGFIKKPKSKFNRNIFFLCDGIKKTDLGIDLIANDFRGPIQNTRLFLIFSSFIFCCIIYLFEKLKGPYSCLPSKESLNYSSSLFKGWFHLWSLYSVQNGSCSFTCIFLLKLKAYKLFENSEADLSWLLF